MVTRMTAAEARRLGIDTSKTGAKRSGLKRVAKGEYWSRCMKCNEEFTSYAAEDRHVAAMRHARFSVLREEP